MLEDIKVGVTVHWSEPTCINTEEKAELLGKIALFDIGARLGRYPQLLRICRGLEIYEADRTDGNND